MKRRRNKIKPEKHRSREKSDMNRKREMQGGRRTNRIKTKDAPGVVVDGSQSNRFLALGDEPVIIVGLSVVVVAGTGSAGSRWTNVRDTHTHTIRLELVVEMPSSKERRTGKTFVNQLLRLPLLTTTCSERSKPFEVRCTCMQRSTCTELGRGWKGGQFVGQNQTPCLV